MRNGRMLGASVRYGGKRRATPRQVAVEEDSPSEDAMDVEVEVEGEGGPDAEREQRHSQDSQDYDSHADSASFEGDAFDSDDDVSLPWLEGDSAELHDDSESAVEPRVRAVIGRDDPWVLAVMQKQRAEIERVLKRQEPHVTDQDVDLNINPEHVTPEHVPEHEGEGESTTQLTRHVALLEQQQRLHLRRLIASHDTVQRAYKTYCEKLQQLEQQRAGKGRKATGVIEELEQFVKQYVQHVRDAN